MDIIILILTTWRLTSLLTSEDGPFGIFERLRKLAGVRYDGDGLPFATNEVAKAFTCPWCLSVWVGAALAIAHYLLPTVAFWLALPFALSAGVIVIQEGVEWLEQVR
jgi:hypothetical protein